MNEKKWGTFEKLEFNELVINSNGKAGIPFDVLREKYGFTIIVNESDVYIKCNELQVSKVALTKSQELDKISSTDNFSKDMEFLKKNYEFKDYYQESVIYVSAKRGIKHYDIIITDVGSCINMTFKGMYENYCDLYSTTNVIPKLLKFYFPLSFTEVLQGLLAKDNIRKLYDGRDTLIKSYDIDSREIIFSKVGSNLS